MASNVNNNQATHTEMINTHGGDITHNYVSQEEQDNINNMNANSLSTTETKYIENNEDSNLNNNHVETVLTTQNGMNIINNGHITRDENTSLTESPLQITEVSAIQDCDTEDISLQNNALSDLMNTYSSDEDMFENFRVKEEFDDPKSEEDCLSSSTSFLSLHESGNSSEDETTPCVPPKSRGVKMKSTRNKGELDLDDLPPIEDLQISVPEDQCLPVGKILNIVDTLVLIKSLKNTPTLDLDSVLFLDKGSRSLGKIFDVIGPVSGPVYCVRFNSHQHIVDSDIKIDQDVYCAPQTEHTSYVPLPDLIHSKGTDASWEKDREPPPEVVEFSDDEEERRVKRSILRTRNNNRNNQQSADGTADPDVPPEPKTRRPTPFEQRMNLRNLLMTASYERRNRLLNEGASAAQPTTSRPQVKSFAPPAPGSIIRAPTLPDIPPLPLPPPQTNPGPPRFTPPQEPCGTPPHPHMSQQRFDSNAQGAQAIAQRLPHHLTSTSLGVFSPPPMSPMCAPLFHQNKKRPSTASPFAHPPRFPSPFTPPMFTTLPPPPIFNDVLLFTQAPPGHPYPHMQHPYTPPPFQFGMPPLLGARTPPSARYRHNSPRPPSMMRPAFGSRHRF